LLQNLQIGSQLPLTLLLLQEEANELETELLQELFTHLLLEAGQVYKQRQQDGWHDDDTAAADQQAWDTAAEADSEEDSDIDEDDEGEAAHQAALKRSKQRRSWKPSKGEVLIILVAMMLLGELFVMLDMLGLFKRR
jgi:DNA-directed RNA polymerase specialized sigma54-like protein